MSLASRWYCFGPEQPRERAASARALSSARSFAHLRGQAQSLFGPDRFDTKGQVDTP
jgi:hypothetical protein